MQDNGKITAAQLRLLVLIFTIGSSIIVATGSMAAEAGRDAWISVMVGGVISLGFVYVYAALYRLHPQLTLVQMNMLVFGRWIGQLVSWVYFVYFLLLTSLLVREIGDFLTTFFLVYTPIQAIHIIYLLIIVWGMRIGLEVLTRAAEIFFPWLLLLFFILIVCLIPKMDIDHLLPVMENGGKPVIRGAIPFLGLPFLELVTFLMMMPTVIQRQQATRALFQGMAGGTMLLFLLVLTTILVDGALIATDATYPSYTLTRQISIGHFLERIEVEIEGVHVADRNTAAFKANPAPLVVFLGIQRKTKTGFHLFSPHSLSDRYTI